MPTARSASYAESTAVPVAKSKAEIDKLLVAFGATDRLIGEMRGYIVVAFVAFDRQVRMLAPLPIEDEVRLTPSGKARATTERQNALAQAERARYRQLMLAIKAKFVAIEAGVTTFESEFGWHFVIDGQQQTIGEFLAPRIESGYDADLIPPMLGVGR